MDTLPIEIIWRVFMFAGEPELWKKYNAKYLKSKLPASIEKKMYIERIRNYTHRNKKLVFQDFF